MARQRKIRRSFVAAAVLAALLVPFHASVAQTSTFDNPKYKMLILTVAMLNKAMQDAANNPMDEWRRANVQRAIQMLPPALIALAGEYKNGTLDGKDFQQAYAVVAQFVDKAAADGYQKFMKKPDRSLIPTLPSNFPKVNAPSVPGGLTGPSGGGNGSGVGERLAIDESRSTQGIAQVEPPKNAALSNELVNLSAVKPASTSSSFSAPRESVRIDESASRDTGVSRVDGEPSSSRLAATQSTASAPASPEAPSTGWQSGSAVVREAARDLSRIEARVGSADLTIRSAADGAVRAPASLRRDEQDEEKKNDKVFEVGGDARDEKARATRSRRPTNKDALKDGKKSSALDTLTHWAVRLAEVTILPGRAFAEGSGGGSEGGGGGEAAQLAAAILFGAAEIIKAIAPMVIAKTQAEADKAIARINSDTQKYLTDQTANTSKYLADQQKDIAIFQSNLARTIASEQQQNVNYRLDRQLAELKEARKDAEAVQTQIRNKEWEYNERRLQIAEEQAAKNYELAQEALKAQLTASGLSSGFANSFDSGNQLTTSSSVASLGGVGGTGQQALGGLGGTSGLGATGQGASSAGTSSVASTGGTSSSGSLASSVASNGGGTGLNLGMGTGKGATSAGLGGGVGGMLPTSARGATGGSILTGDEKNEKGFQRLLAGVGRGAAEGEEEEFEDEINAKDAKGRHAKGKKKPRGLASLRMQTKLTKDGKPVVSDPIAKADGKSSDLIKFFGDSKTTTFATEPAAVAEKPKAN